MRTLKVFTVFAVLLSLCFATTSQAFLSDTAFIDFTGWDANLIDNGPGQTFNDVFPFLIGPQVDVHVEAVGDFSQASKFQASFINDGLLNPNESDTYRFTFTRTIPNLIVKFLTVDSQEALDVIGVGPETYFHNDGAVPNEIPIGGAGLAIVGNGTGINPITGATSGEVITSAQQNLAVIVRHRTLGNFQNKFEFFNLGTFVPEPGTSSMFLFGLLGLMGLRKRG